MTVMRCGCCLAVVWALDELRLACRDDQQSYGKCPTIPCVVRSSDRRPQRKDAPPNTGSSIVVVWLGQNDQGHIMKKREKLLLQK